MYFEECGNKKAPTIVFIHGAGMSRWTLWKQAEAFNDFHCILIDLPEHGESINEKPFSIRDSAIKIIDLIQKNANNRKAHIVGHSLGAKIIIEILDLNPDVVDKAVIASALLYNSFVIKAMINSFTIKISIPMIRNKKIAAMQAKAFGFPPIWHENFFKDCNNMTSENLYRILSEFTNALKLPVQLKQVKNSILIVAGEKELTLMKKSVYDLSEILPNSKGLLIRNALHNFPWVMPDIFNEIIREWINGKVASNQYVKSI